MIFFRRFFSKLYTRLAFSMLLLFILLGSALIYISQKTSESYALELTQRINRDIALHAAEDMALINDGEPNKTELKKLAEHVMFINPIVEVYLLDIEGRILAHALPYESVLLESINMSPLYSFLNKQQPLPIFGDDPRNPDQQKVFSVSPVLENELTVAYLYTVLNGAEHDSVRQPLLVSHNLQVGMMTIVGSILFAVVAGLLIFSVLTRRLRDLVKAVRVYRESSFQGKVLLPAPKDTGKVVDEIDELTIAISGMSERIEQQFSAVKAIDNTRRELIANISHDLRTPLASMQGYLETVLVKGPQLSADEQQKYLQVAYKQSRRLNQLIGELFELSKLESDNVELEWQAFPLMELVQDLIQDYELEAKQRNIHITASCDNVATSVYGDLALIHRVLENLLQNALRHTRDGGEINFTMKTIEKKVWLEVADNGEGIAPSELPHIFDRFYRPETEASKTGHGLGLAIVKRIVELHLSEVNVVSEKDHGAVFKFWLPVPG